MDFNKLAVQAMQMRKRVAFTYDGEDRLVEIHALGLSTANRPCIRGYQVLGGSLSGEEIGWKMFSIFKIVDPKLLDDASLAPRPGYKPGDRGMSTILMEISDVEPTDKQEGEKAP